MHQIFNVRTEAKHSYIYAKKRIFLYKKSRTKNVQLFDVIVKI